MRMTSHSHVDEILRQTRCTEQALEALKADHLQILSGLENSNLENKDANSTQDRLRLLKSSVDKIDLGLAEAQMMASIASHLEHTESEKQKLRSQIRRLCQENSWLREELSSTQQRLQTSEQRCAALEEEKKHLEFMNEKRKKYRLRLCVDATALRSWIVH